MNTELKKEFYNKLKDDKIKINWNKNPIKMDVFLPFLTVEVEILREHFGYDMGWTKRQNKSLGLIISGGCVNGVEYLDCLQFGEKLANQYNNYVNPFYLFDIFTKEGKAFFVDYYKDEIAAIVESNKQSVAFLERQLEEQKTLFSNIQIETEKLTAYLSFN